jgi:predicted small secreted protein
MVLEETDVTKVTEYVYHGGISTAIERDQFTYKLTVSF